MIKTFRGLIADGAQDTIVLHTNDGAMGYRIVKFQGFSNTPGTTEFEGILKIYSVAQTTLVTSGATVDFDDNTLLASLQFSQHTNPAYPINSIVVIDNKTFNQDIFITYTDNSAGATPLNYHLELEQVKLDLNENTVATLEDIRNKGVRTLTT